MTTIQELINEFENIKQTKCKTLQEIVFFDGILSIIEAKYLEKEKEQIITSFLEGKFNGGIRFDEASKEYYDKISADAVS